MPSRRCSVFISYASKHREWAERIALALQGEGHTVFFDRKDLKAGGAYHEPIREAVASADLMVFLCSRESIAAGSYALFELEEARKRWPHPRNRVLPVRIDDVPIADLPAYLKAVTLLEPAGDVVAEVVSLVAERARPRLGARSRWALAAGALVAAAGVTVWAGTRRPPAPVAQWCVSVSPRMNGKHTLCYDTKEACLAFQQLAYASKEHTPQRQVVDCTFMVPPQ